MIGEDNFPRTEFSHPRLPTPPQLTGSQGGLFAYNTIIQRIPAIARRVIAENDFPSAINENLETLAQEILNKEVRQLRDIEDSEWITHIAPYEGQPWLDVPWFFAEAYFYRRILEATHYFQPGQWQGVDPFEYQKRLGLKTSMNSIQALSSQINSLSHSEQSGNVLWNQTELIKMLYVTLWGNQADLSLFPADEDQRSHPRIGHEQTHILVDDTAQLADRMISWKGGRFDIIVDNAGFELFCDLCLAEFLLSSQIAGEVCLHLKAHPTFVSDAMLKDVDYTLEFLSAEGDSEVKSLISRLQKYLKESRLTLRDHPFWTTPLVFWDMPEPLRQELAPASLILLKGDANYRRLLGDCQWSFTTPFTEIVCYFPASLAALRTLKSELAAGLQLGQAEAMSQKDAEWLTNGRWGVIQFVDLSSR